MKKIIKMCTMIAITLCIFSGCTNKNYINQKKEANLILDKLIISLENDDKEAIKGMFSAEVQGTLGEKLDNQIEEMLKYFDGNVLSYDKIGTVAGGDSIRDGKLAFSRISNAHCGKIETETNTYRLSFSDVLVDNSQKQNEGIWRIWIGKSDDDYLIIGVSEMPI